MPRIGAEFITIARSAARTIPTGLVLYAVGLALKLEFPVLDLAQISLAATLLAWFFERSQDQQRSRTVESEQRWAEVKTLIASNQARSEAELEAIRAETNRISDGLALHCEQYSHGGIESDFRATEERTLSNSAQISTLWRSLSMAKEIAEIKARLLRHAEEQD